MGKLVFQKNSLDKGVEDGSTEGVRGTRSVTGSQQEGKAFTFHRPPKVQRPATVTAEPAAVMAHGHRAPKGRK